MVNVTLQELNADNWRECARLSTSEDQKGFRSANVWSIAQSRFDPTLVPCAVYNSEGIMVGFVMYAHMYKPGGMPEREPAGYWSVVSLMIDHRYQGKGYGRAAIKAVIERVKQTGQGKVLSLSYKPENIVARELYRSLGFKETGETNGGEIVARLQLEGE